MGRYGARSITTLIMESWVSLPQRMLGVWQWRITISVISVNAASICNTPQRSKWQKGIIIIQHRCIRMIVIWLLMMGVAFLGYVLPWGLMSFWALTVITNLITVIPVIGSEVLAMPVITLMSHLWLHGHVKVTLPIGKCPFTICKSCNRCPDDVAPYAECVMPDHSD